MAFTPDQLQALDDAIASGELTVRANGREVTYRSLRDLLLARDAIARALADASAPSAPAAGSARHRLASFAHD